MSTRENVNTVEYWNHRFTTGDWARFDGYRQTRSFAEAQVGHYRLDRDFAGTLCDFGCGAGDAFPIYNAAFPRASLIGVDFSAGAIELARERFGAFAKFVCGEIDSVPDVSVIVCSNVIEHIEDDQGLVTQLIERCGRLYVIVPYREQDLISEHLRSYDKNSFDALKPSRRVVFNSRGWSEYGIQLYRDIYLKNLARALLGRKVLRRRRQVLFEFQGKRSADEARRDMPRD